jgi:hypothetical protein
MNHSEDLRTVDRDQFLPLHHGKRDSKECLVGGEIRRSERPNVHRVRDESPREHAGGGVSLFKP